MGSKRIAEEQKLWDENELKDSLAKHGERKDQFRTLEGAYEVKRLYTPLDLEERGIDYVKDIGFPGRYPYTRGIDPNMYRTQMWETPQYTG